jgi:hypothetical protein
MTSRHVPAWEVVFRRITQLSVALFLGCGGGGPLQDPLEPVEKFGSVVQLTVQNNDFKDAAVYARWSGFGRRRVGMVTGKTSDTFTFDWQADRIRIEAEFIAGGNFTTDEIEVSGGDHLDVVILSESP